MSRLFNTYLKKLNEVAFRFDEENSTEQLKILSGISKQKIGSDEKCIQYFELLLFILAHPDDHTIHTVAEKEMKRLTAFMKKNAAKTSKHFSNTGMPFTSFESAYSHDCLLWLAAHTGCELTIKSFNHPVYELNDVLKLTLPSLEKIETTNELTNEQLLNKLKVKKGEQLNFLLT